MGLDVHDHLGHLAAQQRPEAGHAVARVDQGDIENGIQLFAQGGQHEGHAAGLGLEQVPVG
ncbi:hypothetical protein D9M71_850020 [compost metagenome]